MVVAPGRASNMGRNGEPKQIVAIGETLWDVFPDGRRPGGAPCNVAFHAAQLGDRGIIVSRVGADEAGDELIRFLAARGVQTTHIQRDRRKPTGTVLVRMEQGEPRYTITEDVAWDHLQAEPDARGCVREADAVVVGSLAQRRPAARAAIRTLLGELGAETLVVYDVNLRPPFVDADVVEATCRAARVVKMNEDEVVALERLFARTGIVPWLVEEAGVEAVCVTRGPRGATLVTADGAVSVPAPAIDTAAGDPVGAGDAFTAAMTRELVRGTAPEAVLTVANRYAALVASRMGAMPAVTAEDLRAIGLMRPAPPPPAGGG